MSGISTEHWDGDRRLVLFANMLADAAQAAARGENPSDKEKEMIKFLNRTPRSAEETKYVILEACALLEYGASPKVYEQVKLIAEGLHTSPAFGARQVNTITASIIAFANNLRNALRRLS